MCIDTFGDDDIFDNESMRAMQRNTEKHENDEYLVASKCRFAAVASKLD